VTAIQSGAVPQPATRGSAADIVQMTLASPKPPVGNIKCVVWDLDNTVWDGVLLEHGQAVPRPGVIEVIRTLDQRGILHSIASRSDRFAALARLDELGLTEYFLYPQIGWNPKSAAVGTIAKLLNIGLDAIAFVDDQEFELAEVAHSHPQIMCVDAKRASSLADEPEFMPRFITAESRSRRHLYRSLINRTAAEEEFVGSPETFLATLGMVFMIREATVDDLQRAEELTIRTNQLNSTGVTYSYAQLEAFSRSADHLLLVACLTDRFGSYGTIGLALVAGSGVHQIAGDAVGDDQRRKAATLDVPPPVSLAESLQPTWTLKLLLMSCRVMSRGVGTLLLNHIMRLARGSGARLTAQFAATDRNRIMYVTYRFAGFKHIADFDGVIVLEASQDPVPEPPPYVRLVAHSPGPPDTRAT
jgi:FkbH-like protein